MEYTPFPKSTSNKPVIPYSGYMTPSLPSPENINNNNNEGDDNNNNNNNGDDMMDDMLRYMENQQIKYAVDINDLKYKNYERDLPVLFNWLYEVKEEYKSDADTYFSAVNYIYRLLTKVEVSRRKLQLMGAAAFLVGSKMFDRWPIRVNDLVYISNNSFSRDTLKSAEALLLKYLNYETNYISPYNFLRTYLSEVFPGKNDHVHSLSLYILIIVSFYPVYANYLSSELATASLMLAGYTLGNYKDYQGDSPSLRTRKCISDCYMAWRKYKMEKKLKFPGMTFTKIEGGHARLSDYHNENNITLVLPPFAYVGPVTPMSKIKETYVEDRKDEYTRYQLRQLPVPTNIKKNIYEDPEKKKLLTTSIMLF